MKKEHFEILLEEMRGQFELVLEGHVGLNAKIDNLKQDIDEKLAHSEFEAKLVKEKLVSIDGKVDDIADDLKNHRADTEAHPSYMVRERPDEEEL